MSISRISFCGDSKNPIKPMHNKTNTKNLSTQNLLDPLDYLEGYLKGKSIRHAEEMKEFLTQSQILTPVKPFRDGFKAATGENLPESSVIDKMVGKMLEKFLKLGVSYRPYSSSEAAEAHQTASKVMAKIADLVTVKPFKLK